MRIRKLELHGFKSFPDRTTLTFGAGISCIVGPNGCGKSNIVDALRWCIGEQSARSLRGSEMSDVIFAGSQVRKPVGFAEVSITLTSEGGEPFPGEFAQFNEVSVGRRLHRSGASEYLINQRKVRRRDVQDLFLDTGVGNNLYSFIEQGRIGKIVHAHPEQRRGLIDEAAGISRYKQRRDEARDRLTATVGQLDRAADVADEMSRRVRSLARQVLKAGRFRRLRARVRQDEIALSLARFIALSADRRTLRSRLRTAQAELETAQRGLARREVDLASRREELGVVEDEVDRQRDRVAELDARLRELEGERGFAQKRLTDLDGREVRERDALKAAEEAQRRARTDLLTATDALAEARSRRASARARLREVEAQGSSLGAALAEAQDRARATEASYREARAHSDRLQIERDTLQAQVRARPAQLTELREAVEQARRRAAAMVEAAEAARARAVRAKAEAEAAQQARARAATLVEARKDAERVSEAALAEIERATEARALARRQAIDVAQRTASEAEGRRREAEQVLRRAEEAAASEVRRAIERERAMRHAQRQRALEQARARADRWSSALEEALRVEFEAFELARERRRQERVARIEATRTAQLDALIAGQRSELDQLRADAEVQRKAAMDSVEAAKSDLAARRAQLQQAREGTTEAERALSRAEAALERARAEVEVSAASDRGTAAVREALPRASRLLDALSPDVRRAPWLAEALGDVLGALVLHDLEALQRAAEAAASVGPTTVVLRPEGPLEEAEALAGLALVDELPTAVAEAAARGRPVVVRGTGERAWPDGRVDLGPRAEEGTRLLELEATLEAAEAAWKEAQGLQGRALAERDRFQAAADAAEAQVEARLTELRTLRDALEAQGVALREAQSVALTAARDESRRRAASRERELNEADRREEEGLLERQRLARASIARDRQRGIEAVERALDASEDQARAGEQDRERRARAAARTAAEEQLSRAQDAEVEAVEALSALREAHQAEADKASSPLLGARAELGEAREALEEAREVQERVGRDASDKELFAAKAEAAASGATEAVERSRGALEVAQRDLLHAQRAAEDADRQLARLHAELLDAQARTQGALQAQERAEQEHEERRESVTAHAAAQSRAEVELATWEERERSAAQAQEGSEVRATEAQARQEAAADALREIAEAREQAQADASAAEAEIATRREERAVAWDQLETERGRLNTLREAMREAEEDLRHRFTEVGERGRLVEQLRAEVEAARSEIDTLQQRIEARYQVRLPGLLDQLDMQGRLSLEPDPLAAENLEIDGVVLEPVPPMVLTLYALQDEAKIEAWLARLETSRKDLDRLSDVNLAAYDEYRDVHARHSDLEEQRADLESSVEQIRSAIAKMNRTCRQRFRDTFDLVNQHFQELYPQLVGGGSARLSLTDEEDLLETGVEIFVQPPGKRLQNLSLLSGGEKAMTAIALILALFRVKPSPFCVLDEVDAPLDEANGSRFNQALLDMAEASQFIVISHNRRTMEVASTLYGITMPDPGVSRLVTVDLHASARG
ncbi:MAG: hypothetical protein EA397_15505 [Deltaproteobacteria bacterium]|nr:MAG: hypothetical protein EA397_15505 [Deltaproteobacteria bacterium]